MTPATADGQHTLSQPAGGPPRRPPLRYVDYWGTVVDAFDVHVPHTELVVTATSVVETAAPAPPPPDVGWDRWPRPAVRGPVRRAAGARPATCWPRPELDAVARSLRPPARPARGRPAAVALGRTSTLRLRAGRDPVGTTSAEACALGKGVCQDFAHLALALLRAVGLPARYVSGYLYPARTRRSARRASGESHAWVEFWAGDWSPADPTNLRRGRPSDHVRRRPRPRLRRRAAAARASTPVRPRTRSASRSSSPGSPERKVPLLTISN